MYSNNNTRSLLDSTDEPWPLYSNILYITQCIMQHQTQDIITINWPLLYILIVTYIHIRIVYWHIRISIFALTITLSLFLVVNNDIIPTNSSNIHHIILTHITHQPITTLHIHMELTQYDIRCDVMKQKRTYYDQNIVNNIRSRHISNNMYHKRPSLNYISHQVANSPKTNDKRTPFTIIWVSRRAMIWNMKCIHPCLTTLHLPLWHPH